VTNSSKKQQQIQSQIAKLKKYLKLGFYFSHDYDLTASRQRRLKFNSKLREENKEASPIDQAACDSRYFWNKAILQGFQENNVKAEWFVALIQGHVGCVEGLFGDARIHIILISRRQHLRMGTRLNVRGMDDHGNVGNFVETEQIMAIG